MKYLKVSIRDTGAGIPFDKQGVIFSKFGQACEGEYKSKGTGLGLWISKQIADKMEGDIRMFSKEKVGTVFVIYIKI